MSKKYSNMTVTELEACLQVFMSLLTKHTNSHPKKNCKTCKNYNKQINIISEQMTHRIAYLERTVKA